MQEKLPIADVSLFEMQEEMDEASNEDSTEKFRRELRTMLYAFGDVKVSLFFVSFKKLLQMLLILFFII